MNTPFYIVDVFAREQFTGNQLAVFPDAGGLSTEEMQSLALEMNYSETTFITGDMENDGGYPVRIFTPREEVPFAGHPTLGTAFVIHEYVLPDRTHEITLNLKVGQIPVQVEQDPPLYRMTQQPPEFGDELDPESLAKVLNIDPGDIETRFPIQSVSTGLPFIIVPLKTLSAVKQSQIDHRHYPGLIRNSETKAILIFAPETLHQGNDLHARVFAEYYGVPEDPATGSANGCLAGYLAKYRYFRNPNIDIRVEQGHEIGRPSLLHLRTELTSEGIRVQVGGQVIPVARGETI
ncbi:MAG: PhzF family phenazine biosynthesis protein [Candidatus Marinimicrobia bacterium]|nr:PhzF family phenazine biosynthesis protein [Candidatus Neomarinimicrobiota bacterium]MCF7828547.1 PhzF family phenazine biosynthesis protein [Candidatus Neomarinimicrobiota bacterium]MCF7882030.1 PhzF family phenazine biosynthesis protein [Candidatus Neomarinimicrobiota bacterium]